jgi:hypothetical protein
MFQKHGVIPHSHTLATETLPERFADVHEYVMVPLVLTLGKAAGLSGSSTPSLESFISTVLPEDKPHGPLNRFLFNGQDLASRIRLGARLSALYEAAKFSDAPQQVDPRINQAVSLANDLFDQGTSHLSTFIKSGSLTTSSISWLKTNSDSRGAFLTERIPPHIGHGMGRLFCSIPTETQRDLMEQEARQDRNAAAMLFKSLQAFIEHPGATTLQYFLSTLASSGDWLSCITTRQANTQGTPLETIARTLETFRNLIDLGKVYEELFLQQNAQSGTERISCGWYEISRLSPVHVHERLPLYAAALAIAGR